MMRMGLAIAAIIMLMGCRTVTEGEGPAAPRVPPDVLERSLVVGQTRAPVVWELAGQPVTRKPVKEFEVWTYEWYKREERTAYSGTKIGEERAFMKGVPGYTHVLMRKTTGTLIFTKDGILSSFRFVNE